MKNRAEQKMIQAAFAALNNKRRILAPETEALVEYKEFDPCKATQLVAIVNWPAIVNCRQITLKHNICE